MLAGSCPVIKYYALPHLVLKKIRNVLSKHHFVNSPVVSHIDAFPSIGVRLAERKEKVRDAFEGGPSQTQYQLYFIGEIFL